MPFEGYLDYFISASAVTDEYQQRGPYSMFKRDANRFYFVSSEIQHPGANQQFFILIAQTDDGGRTWYYVHRLAIPAGPPIGTVNDSCGQQQNIPGSVIRDNFATVYDILTDTLYFTAFDAGNCVENVDEAGAAIYWWLNQYVCDTDATGPISINVNPEVWTYNGTTGDLENIGPFLVSVEGDPRNSFGNTVGGFDSSRRMNAMGMALSNDGTKLLNVAASIGGTHEEAYYDPRGNLVTAATVVSDIGVAYVLRDLPTGTEVKFSFIPFASTSISSFSYTQHSMTYKDKLENKAYVRSVYKNIDESGGLIGIESQFAVMDLDTGDILDVFGLPSIPSNSSSNYTMPLFYSRAGVRYMAMVYNTDGTNTATQIFLYIRNLSTNFVNSIPVPNLPFGNFEGSRVTYDADLDTLYIWRTVYGSRSLGRATNVYYHESTGDGFTIGAAIELPPPTRESIFRPYVEQFGETMQLENTAGSYGLIYDQAEGGFHSYFWVIGNLIVPITGGKWKTLEV